MTVDGMGSIDDLLMNYCGVCGLRLARDYPQVCTCGKAWYVDNRPCAAALVLVDGGLVLVRRNQDPFKGDWDIPGGHCDLREHPQDTAVRECREEVGIEVELAGLLGIWVHRPPNGHRLPPTVTAYYLATYEGVVPARAPDAEIAGVEVFAPTELPRDIAFPDPQQEVLATWLSCQNLR